MADTGTAPAPAPDASPAPAPAQNPSPQPDASASTPSPISVSSLMGPAQTPLAPAQSNPIPHYPVATLPSTVAPLQPTEAEGRATGISDLLQGLNLDEAGKSQFAADQYNRLGYGSTRDANGNVVANDPTMIDLNTKLGALTNEATAIPLQVQQEFNGRGATTAGVAPIQSARLRDNAVQALTVTSLIAARQGKLSYAKQLVDNAVSQKYGPIEDKIAALTKNLDLVKNSPDYSLEDKNRAQQQQLDLNKQAMELEIAKTNYMNAQTEILKYATVADSSTLHAMTEAAAAGGTPSDVAAIAAKAGYAEPSTGRYKDVTKTLTDAFGNQYQSVRILDTLTGNYINAPAGTTSAQLNANADSLGTNGQPGTGSGSAATAAGLGPAAQKPGSVGGLPTSFAQYGLLAKTDFNPNASGQKGIIDTLAANYLDSYTKNGTVPTASTLGRNMKPGGFAQVENRAKNLYFQATGQPMPLPKEMAGLQTNLVANNTLLNNLKVQEGTIRANADLLLKNLTGANLNQAAPTINKIVDGLRYAFGDPNVASYMAQNTTISNELGSLLALKNAQGTTVHDKLEAAGIIDKNDSSDQIAAKVKIMLQEAVNAHDAIQAASGDLYRKVDPLLQNPDNPLRKQIQDQAFVESSLASQGLHYDALVSEMQQKAPAGQQPALDAKTGAPVFATPDDISNGLAIPL